MRKKILAGNWKMHSTRTEAYALLRAIKDNIHLLIDKIEVIVLPSFVYLPLAEENLSNTPMSWGGQNLYLGRSGAFTGEISGSMLVEFGCQYVLVGHSERRSLFKEDLALVAAKFKAALDVGLKPILCVGETLEQRTLQKTESVIIEQLESVIQAAKIESFYQAVIAYEPVWAIGTGLTATPAQAQAIHELIRKYLAKYDLELANTMRILYGGSIKADNASGLLTMPDIDGGLVGGASLNAEDFLAIGRACLGVSV